MRITIFTLLATIYANIFLAGQDMGIITGQVSDHFTKQGIPYASVVILNNTRGASSDAEGRFEIKNLAPGTYQIRVTAIGYSPKIVTDVRVNNSAPAQLEVLLQEEVVQLQGVTIRGDYFNNGGTQFNSINTFGYEEIRRSAGGFEDVIRALSALPGVAQADAGRNDLVVRGGAPSENLYVVQGMEIPNINHFGTQGASGGPLSFVNLDFVKETSFSSGGFPVTFGDRLSSVLTIELRNGRSDKIGGKGTISASQFGLNLEGPLLSSSTFIFSARRSYLDFIFKAAGFGFVPEYWDFTGKIDYAIDNKNTFSFLTITALDNIRYFNNTDKQKFDNSRVMGSNQVQYISGLTFRHLLENGFIRVVLSRNYTDYNTSQKDFELKPVFLNSSTEAENKLKIEYAQKLSASTEMTTGGLIDHIPFRADIKLPSFYTSFGERLPYDSLKVNTSYLKSALFFSLSNTWSELFSTNVGLRADYFNGINSQTRLSPRFSASFQPIELWTINFSTGMYYQSPSYIWLAAGNTNLKPLQMKQFITGIEYRFRDDAIIKLEGYIKKYSDYPASLMRRYLVLANTGAGFAGAEDNFSAFGLEPLASIGSGKATGLELSAQKKLSSIPCYGLLSVTYNKTVFTAADGLSRPGSYDQRWIVNVSGGYRITESLEFSIKFRYASGRPYTPYNTDGTQNSSNYNTMNLPTLHGLDIRLDKHWFLDNLTLITYLDVQNLYGRRNVSAYRWNSKNQNIEENKGIGVLPSLGLSVEF